MKIGDGDEKSLTMAPQFYIFWAVSVPVTVLVLIMWILWLQRVEIAKFIGVRWRWKVQKPEDGKEA